MYLTFSYKIESHNSLFLLLFNHMSQGKFVFSPGTYYLPKYEKHE